MTLPPTEAVAVRSNVPDLDGIEPCSLIQSLIVSNPDAMLVLQAAAPDPLLCPVVYVNEQFSRMTGFNLGDFEAGQCPVVAQLYSLPLARSRARHAIANRKPDEIESSIHGKDGSTFTVTASLMPVARSGSADGYIVIELHDITELKQIAERGVAVGADMRSVLASARCLVWHGTVENRGESFCWYNHIEDDEAARRWLPVAVLPGEPFFAAVTRAVHPDDRARIDAKCRSALRSGASDYRQEYRVRLETGEYRWLAEDVRVERLADYKWRLVGIMTDITTQKHLEAEREELLIEAIDRGNRDSLTGLWNHRAFHKRLNEEADLALANNTSIAVVAMDMDNFKFFNDCYGHAVGDEVLCEVARALRHACRPEDTPARFGGDEFALIVPLIDSGIAEEMVARITGSLRNIGYRPDGGDSAIPIRVAWGMAIYPSESSSRFETLALADARLMQAKSGIGEAAKWTDRLSKQLMASVKGFSMLNALVSSVDNKDRYTRRHSEDVLLYALQIATELGLDESICHHIQVAALLHDVGKIGVPDNILRKPARLTPDEYEAIKLHPTMGAIMVGSVAGFEETLPAVRHHHERWDGSGYPDGLVGAATPLMARILSVADAYSAMTTDRPYRTAMTSATARTILLSGAGSQWDPTVVNALLASHSRPVEKPAD